MGHLKKKKEEVMGPHGITLIDVNPPPSILKKIDSTNDA